MSCHARLDDEVMEYAAEVALNDPFQMRVTKEQAGKCLPGRTGIPPAHRCCACVFLLRSPKVKRILTMDLIGQQVNVVRWLSEHLRFIKNEKPLVNGRIKAGCTLRSPNAFLPWGSNHFKSVCAILITESVSVFSKGN